MEFKRGDTVCGWVRNIGREGQESGITKLSELAEEPIDMFTTVFIGSKTTKVINGRMLPYFDGYYYLQKIRKYSQIPVLFISSRSDKPEKIMAMTLGGDDYVEKPFDMDVLVAKINALLRRSYTFTEESTILTYKGIILNLKNNILSYGGREAELTKNEFNLMEEFFKNPEKILNRDDLMEILWKSHIFIDDNSLTVNISRLRTKLKKLGLDDVIQTKKSQGYIFIKENAL